MTLMHGTNLDGLDLNLLRVLDALLLERHLTRAARRVGLSQPATSHALARLRAHLGDPLFVRGPGGLVPTERAARLEAPLRAAMGALAAAVSGGEAFAPATAQATFSIATADYGAFVLLPAMLERLAREAPQVDLWVRAVSADPLEQLARGDADLLLAPLPGARPLATIHARLLYRERYVCVVRKDHPRARRGLDLDTWCELPHAFVAPRGSPGGVVDEVLAKHGRRRRVALALPSFLIAPHVVACSDLVLTVGARIAEAYAALLPLKVLDAPVPLPGFEVRMWWHERTHHDPAQRWLRKVVTEVVRT